MKKDNKNYVFTYEFPFKCVNCNLMNWIATLFNDVPECGDTKCKYCGKGKLKAMDSKYKRRKAMPVENREHLRARMEEGRFIEEERFK